MILEDFRKSYPFIAYGEEYANWCKRMKWYEWLYKRLNNDKPSMTNYGSWKWLHCLYKNALDECEKEFKILPKPTKEQHNQNYDITVVGKWPEKSTKDIKKFLRKYDQCNDVATDVAIIMTENDYHINVLKEKTCDSIQDLEKGGHKWKN